jgi:hypothetical protein
MKDISKFLTAAGLICVVALLASPNGRAQTPLALDVRQLMSAQDYKDAGLEKLSPSETLALNAWITNLVARVQLSSKLANAAPATRENVSAIESAIDGEFEGWTGETIFKLQNGQIWQQAEYDYDYEYEYSPEVTIYKTSGCWKMQVKDVEDAICVKRLK